MINDILSDSNDISSFLTFILPDFDSKTPVLDISRNFGLIIIALATDAFVLGETAALSTLSYATEKFNAAMDSFVSPRPQREVFPHPFWSHEERAFIIDTVSIAAYILSVANADPDHFQATNRLVAAIASTAAEDATSAFLITPAVSIPS
jgi:hypothetical protein